MNKCTIIEMGGVKNGHFTRNYFIESKELKNNLNKYDGDIYSTIYKYDSTDQNTANYIAPLYLDLDIDDIETNFLKVKQDLLLVMRRLKTVFNLSDKDIELYFSGSKGFHILVSHNIFGFEPSRDINKQYKKIAIDLKTYTVNKSVDTKIYDNKRLFRVPNTINHKTGLYKVPISYDKIKEINSFEELRKYASSKKPMMPRIYKFNPKARLAFDEMIERIDSEEKAKVNTKLAKEFIQRKELLPCVQYILNHGAAKGNRNNSTVALANSLFQVGKESGEVLEIISYWNATKNEDPLDDSEIRTTVQSAYNNAQANRYYGCTMFKDLDVCVKGCPIHRN
jgi:hypothetical protein